MISKFVREQRKYTQRELADIMECSEEKTVHLIRRLKEFGVLKVIQKSKKQQDMTDLLEENIEIVNIEMGDTKYLYVFNFVGVIIIEGIVLKCYPKYILSITEPKNELCQVMKVVEKYNSREQAVKIFNDYSESGTFNPLAIILFFIHDYYENGLYTNTEKTIEINGVGEILWDKTIDKTIALISKGRPYYAELYTRKQITNQEDYFKKLHECILTKVSSELKRTDLLDIFGLYEINLTDIQLEDFGEREYILYRIEKELSIQFNTRKQLVLKTMYTYISDKGSLNDISNISIIGTNNFKYVWEDVCKTIFDNQCQKQLGHLKLPVPLKEGYDRRQKLIELIEKPLWTITGECAQDTLIPDLVSICKVNGKHQFIIFDAKYYNAHLEKGIVPKGQPGIESVTKQCLYQLSYQKFIGEHNFSAVKNCFLLPTEKELIISKGQVRMEMFRKLGLEDIEVRLIPANMAYEYYLSNRKLNIEKLEF